MEYASIIQHPNGGTKHVANRENQIIKKTEHFLLYETDTHPGSSGSPVFNDQWQMVALHHSGVPKTDENGNWLKKDNTPWQKGDDDALIDWIANEGVRISSIYNKLSELNPTFRQQLEDAVNQPQESTAQTVNMGETSSLQGQSSGNLERATIIQPVPGGEQAYQFRNGYQEQFLPGFPVPLPVLPGDQLLPYENFSVVFSYKRRLARITGVNVDSTTYKNIRRSGRDKWRYDPRIRDKMEAGRLLYDGTPFDYGHMVRRMDACSGKNPELGEEDTFHLSNASPQHHDLNTKTWNNLEDDLLNNLLKLKTRASIFTGPVFGDDDPYEPTTGIRVPREFFKIIAYLDSNNRPAALGWVQRQPDLSFLSKEAAPSFDTAKNRIWQLPIAKIAEQTGLPLTQLIKADVFQKNSTGTSREGLLSQTAKPVENFADLIL